MSCRENKTGQVLISYFHCLAYISDNNNKKKTRTNDKCFQQKLTSLVKALNVQNKKKYMVEGSCNALRNRKVFSFFLKELLFIHASCYFV